MNKSPDKFRVFCLYCRDMTFRRSLKKGVKS
jgi:hypothetical protein